MPIFKSEDVIAYKVGEKIYHPECYRNTKERWIADDVVRQDELEEYTIICDQCGKEIE